VTREPRWRRTVRTSGRLHCSSGRRYASFGDLLEVYAELIEEGCFQRGDDGLGSVNRDAELGKQEARLAAAPPHPLYGDSREIAADPARWPEHGLESTGRLVREKPYAAGRHA
jgi:hypothetical protein